MTKEQVLSSSLSLLEGSVILNVGSIDPRGYPYIKAMVKIHHEGLSKIFFCTRSDTKRVAHFLANNKATVYMHEPINHLGLLLVGHISVHNDLSMRQRMWREGLKAYFPKGIDDPFFNVLSFTAIGGNYYEDMRDYDFDL